MSGHLYNPIDDAGTPAPTDVTPWMPVQRTDIGSVAIDTYSQAALVDEVLHHALHGRKTRQVVTVNAQFYVLAEKSRRFRQCVREAHYVCADGMPIVWACSALSDGRIPRIAGVDLISKLCRYGAAHKLRLYLLGGQPGAAEQTAEILKQRYPGIQIAGTNCPPFGFEQNHQTLRQVLNHIAAAKPHVIFVGLGAPKQEFFIRDYIRRINVPLAIGIGGSFDILSGKLKRAPSWMQSGGLEWAYRLLQEPERLWKRYLIGNLEFLWYLLKWRVIGAWFGSNRFALETKTGTRT